VFFCWQESKKPCPCLNEEKNLEIFTERLEKTLKKHSEYLFELLFINDGSTDQTQHIIRKLSTAHSWIRAISFTRNFGKEAALTAGLDKAQGDALIFIDADLQHPPEVISQFISAWENGAVVVSGRRTSRTTDSRAYSILAHSFYWVHNHISDVKVVANVGDFRLIDKTVANQLKNLPERCRFMKGMFAWVGYEQCFIDYEVDKRLGGKSSFNKWRSWNFAIEGITSFSTVPLRVWTYIGLLVLFIGLCYSVIIIVRAFIHGIETPGYVTLLTAIVIFGGIQLMGIGILGEYIGRIYMETKQRPPYLVKDVIGGSDDSTPKNTAQHS